MKKRHYLTKLLSMTVAANLVFSSLTVPVFSAELTGSESSTSVYEEQTDSLLSTENEVPAEKTIISETEESDTEVSASDKTDETTVPSIADMEENAENSTYEADIADSVSSTLAEEADTSLLASEETAADPDSQEISVIDSSAADSAIEKDSSEENTEESQEPILADAVPVEISVSDANVTKDTTSLTVNLSRVPGLGILRIIQLDAGDTYNKTQLNSYTSLHFSLMANLEVGENVLDLTTAPTPGTQLLVVLRDSEGDSVVDYVSDPIYVTKEGQDSDQSKAPEEVLKNTSVTLIKDGEPRTENFTQQESSATVRVKLDSFVDKCFLRLCGYAGNTSFDPDSNFNKVLWSGWVTDGFEQTLSFTQSMLPLPVGYDIIACLNVPVGEDFYRPSLSQSLEVVDKNGQGFQDYTYPNASIDETELQEGATSLHISLAGDERLFQAAKEGKTEINVSVAQYPEGDDFDFESSSQISLLRIQSFTEPVSGLEVSFPDTPLKAGYRVRAVAYWDQNPDIYLPKGNDYESSFHMPDDSVPVIGKPAVSINGTVKTTDTSLEVEVSGSIPDGCVLLVKQYDAKETSFTTQGGTLVGSKFNFSSGKISLAPQNLLVKDNKIVAFLLQSGTVLAQSEPAIVTAVPDFTISLDNGPVTEETTELNFTVTANDPSITAINMAALCRVDENGNVNPTSSTSYISRLFMQKPGALSFTGITGLKAGDKLRLVLRYQGGVNESSSEDITVLAPLAAESITILNTKITTETTEISAVVTGCDSYKDGYFFLSTGTPSSDGDGDSRIRLGSQKFTGAGNYTFSINSALLKAGNTVQAYLYKYDADNDRVSYKYSDSVMITSDTPVVKEATVEIVTDTIRADRTDVWVSVDFLETLTGTLKLYTYTGDSFDRDQAEEIYSGSISPAANSQRVTFGSKKLTADKKLIAELILSDGTSVLSNSKEIQPEPEKVKPTVTITSSKVTAGMTHIKAASNFDSSFSKASFKLYQFTGDQLDPEKDTVISSGDAYYSNRGNLSFYCGGKLVVDAKLQLVITAGEEEARSNVVEVQPSPDFGTPYAAFEVSAVKSNATSVEVTVDYSDEYLSFGDDFYCDVSIYEFSGSYTDKEFEDNEMWEQVTKVPRVGQVNSRTGETTKGKLTIPIRDGVTLNPGDRLIIKLRLPHTEWEGEEADYLSTSVPIIGENETITAPRVLLYNLSADISMGVRLRKILEEQGIEAVDVSTSQLGETLGYLAGMDGYEANPNPYTGSGSNTEFMVMANFSEAQLDRFLDAMTQNGIRIDHKAVTTAYNVDYEFHQLIDDIKEEHETFQALITLNQLVKDAEKLTEEQYGQEARWEQFQEALAAANQVLTSEEPTLEELQKADADLRGPYLALTKMTELSGNAVITLTPQEDGTYTLEASLPGADKDSKLTYQWNSGETGAILKDVPADKLITKIVTITGENQYGSKKAQLRVPSKPDFAVSAGKDQLTVNLTPLQAEENCPAPDFYTVSIYHQGQLAGTQTVSANARENSELTGTFDGLESASDYTIKVSATSSVGQSDTTVKIAATTAADAENPDDNKKPEDNQKPDNGSTSEDDKKSDNDPGSDDNQKSDDDQNNDNNKKNDDQNNDDNKKTDDDQNSDDNKKSDDSQNPSKDQTAKKNNTTETATAPKTADNTNPALLFLLLMLSGVTALGSTFLKKRREK